MVLSTVQKDGDFTLCELMCKRVHLSCRNDSIPIQINKSQSVTLLSSAFNAMSQREIEHQKLITSGRTQASLRWHELLQRQKVNALHLQKMCYRRPTLKAFVQNKLQSYPKKGGLIAQGRASTNKTTKDGIALYFFG